MDIVFATESRIVSDPKTGVGVGVNIGEHWADDDPVVTAYPQLFTDDPRYGLRSSTPLDDEGYPAGSQRSSGAIEETTAGPGEKRTRTK